MSLPLSAQRKIVFAAIATVASVGLVGATFAVGSSTQAKATPLSSLATPTTVTTPTLPAAPVSSTLLEKAPTTKGPAAAPVSKGESVVAIKATDNRPSYVVATTGKQLVRIDGQTGKTTKVLVDLTADMDNCIWISDVNVDAVSNRVFFIQGHRTGGKCQGMVMTGKTDATQFGLAVQGNATEIELSPNGRYLAMNFVAIEDEEFGRTSSTVIDLTNETSVNFATEAERVDSFVFTPDSKSLLTFEFPCGCGDEGPVQPIKITKRDVVTGKASAVTAPILQTVTLMDTVNNGYLANSSTDDKQEIVLLDSNFNVIKTATTFTKGSIFEGKSDGAGDHVLFIDNYNLMISDKGGKPVKTSAGILGADW